MALHGLKNASILRLARSRTRKRRSNFSAMPASAGQQAALHRADVYMGMEKTVASDSAGGQYSFDDANIYAPKLVGADSRTAIALKSVFLADGVKVRTGRRGQNVVIELDCAHANDGIREWLAHIERILALDFYRLGV